LNELEEEVKQYKQETLKLQKKRESLDMELKKIEVSKQEFERWKDAEQHHLKEEVELEWKKLRREKKNFERESKLRVHQQPDRKCEIDTLILVIKTQFNILIL